MDHPELHKADRETRIIEIREPSLIEKSTMLVKAYWVQAASIVGILICAWQLIKIGAMNPI